MRPFGQTIPFAVALELTRGVAAPIEQTEVIPVNQADGRVAAADVHAAADVPPFDRAAMDGYAMIAGEDGNTSGALRCIDRVFTGEVSQHTLQPGECVEIATGAPIPAGADAVVMVERTTRDGDLVSILENVAAGQNIGRRGNDFKADDLIVPAGQLLDPAKVGAIAATGGASVTVFARPSVALVSTGNEVVMPGSDLGPGQIHDINRFTLAAIVHRHGGVATALPAAGDTVDELTQALGAALACDVVVFSGGSSVGDRDLIRDVVAARGEILYHGIAVKPGKPTLLAIVERTPVFGMPGNPTSCLSNGYLLLAPFLRRVARLPEWLPRTVALPLARSIRSSSDRHQFYTVRVRDNAVEPAFKGSGEITSMAHADGYIEIATGTEAIDAGTVVTVTLF